VADRTERDDPPASLLSGVLAHHVLSDGPLADRIDPGYRAAADRRGGAPVRGPAQRVWLIGGTVLVGLLLGVAARNAAALEPAAEQTSHGLAAEVVQARGRTDELSKRAQDLAEQVDAARKAALAGDSAGEQALGQVSRLEMADAAVPVTGPGLRITVSDPPSAPGAPTDREQTVLDRDLQVLVNALWSSGAEAIALGGVRLHPLATVRQAGGAMLVDNRPVGQPYLFEIIGDPETLQTNLVSTDGYGRFSAFAQIYHTEFTLEPVDELTLPAGSPATRLAVPESPQSESPALPQPAPTTKGGR
jgi:uncharacterized protein YlxW (UPF0749 family)